MAWTIELSEKAKRQLSRLDRPVQKRIRSYLQQKIAESEHPKQFALPLRGDLSDFWKFRIGDYRVLAEIHEENRQVVIALSGGPVERKAEGGP